MSLRTCRGGSLIVKLALTALVRPLAVAVRV